LIAVIAAARNAMASAKKQFDEVQEAMERLRQSAKQLQTEVAGAMAAAGQPVAATGKARAIAQRLEAGGLAREKAVSAAPYFVNEKGEQIVSDEEAALITAGIQAGQIKPMEGATPEKRQRALEKARRELDRNRQEVENARQQYQVEHERLYRDAALGGISEIQQIIEKETGLTGDAARARAETIQRQIKEGFEGGTYTVVPGFEGMPESNILAGGFGVGKTISGMVPESWRGYIPGAYIPAEQEDVLLRGIRSRAAPPATATPPAQPPAPQPAAQPATTGHDEEWQKNYELERWLGKSEEESVRGADRTQYVRQEIAKWEARDRERASRPAATQPAPVQQTIVHETVQHFHGPTYVGRPGDRFETRERVPQ
jgi:cell division septum initiation protein DivIVA